MHPIEASELILNPDGSIYHLHLNPGDIADTILLVGDQGRVPIVSKYFDKITFRMQNREFVTHTGLFRGKPVTVISTGIGTDNIDIVLNELDAIANIDLNSRKQKPQHRKLRFIRLGTSGALQDNIPVNSFLLTKTALGFDGLLHYYANSHEVREIDLETQFVKHTKWNDFLPRPYAVNASEALFNCLYDKQNTRLGITITASGFYAPQGRRLRLPVHDKSMNNKLHQFRYFDLPVTNFEMESSALYGLARLMQHEAITLCAVIANRVNKKFSADYTLAIEQLIRYTLERL